MTRLGTASILLSLAFAPGCSQGPAEAPPPPRAAQTPPEASAGPWRYTPALRAAIPPGLAVSPVFELADGQRGLAEIAVAVASEGAPARLEVWEFDQNNPRERLERVGEARALLALEGGERGELDRLRVAIARPGTEFVRLRGLPSTPEAMVPELVRLAAVVRDAQASPELRAEALASLTYALDDHLLLTENRLPRLLAALADGDLEVVSREPLGERRVTLTLRDPPHRLTLARTGERWVVSDLTLAPKAAPAAP